MRAQIGYDSLPSFSDGFSAFVVLEDRPCITLKLSAAKYREPASPEETMRLQRAGMLSWGGRKSVPFSQPYLDDADVQRLWDAIGSAQIPLLERGGVGEMDGTLHRLSVQGATVCTVEAVWGSVLPQSLRGLAPIVEVFDRYAKEAGLLGSGT